MDVDCGDLPNSGGGGGGGDDITSDLLQKFSCMNTNDRDVLVQQFKVLLGEKCSESNAEFWLDMNNWNLQAAVCSYFDYDSQNSAYPFPLKLPSMSFCADGSFVDRMPPNTPFIYQCVVTNSGDDAWPLGCSLRYIGGTQMSGEERVLLPSLSPGQSAEVRLSMISPDTSGGHQCQWRPATLTGQFFGETIFIIITVYDDLQSVTQQLSDAHLMDAETSGGGVADQTIPPATATRTLPPNLMSLTSSTVTPLGTRNSPQQSAWDSLVNSANSNSTTAPPIYPMPAPGAFTAGMCLPGSTAAGFLPTSSSGEVSVTLLNGFTSHGAYMPAQEQHPPQLMLTHLSQPPLPSVQQSAPPPPASEDHHLDDTSMS